MYPFISLELVMLTVTLSNKFTVSYTDNHMYSNTLVHLERWREDFLLSSMATIVDLSKGNTYLASLFVWCMSGAPCVFDGKRALVMSLFMWCAICG